MWSPSVAPQAVGIAERASGRRARSRFLFIGENTYLQIQWRCPTEISNMTACVLGGGFFM